MAAIPLYRRRGCGGPLSARTERWLYRLVAIFLAGLTYLFADQTHNSFVEYIDHRDYDEWVQSPGVLQSLELKWARSGTTYGFAVYCEYHFEFAGKTQAGTTFDLDATVKKVDAAKAEVEAVLGIAGRAQWRTVLHGDHEGWALDNKNIPLSVRHSPRYPSASTLTATEPMSPYLYWLLLPFVSLLTLVTGLACLLFLMLPLTVESPEDLLKGFNFRDHSKQQLREWARSMRYFRFITGPGGMLDHHDRLAVILKLTAPEDRDKIATALGVEGRVLPGSPMPSVIMVNGVEVCVYDKSFELELSITNVDKPYGVAQTTVESARSVELYLDRVADKVSDPPQDNSLCVCPKYYPSFWQDEKITAHPQPTDLEIHASTERRRNQAYLMIGISVTLIFLAVMAWREPIDGALLQSVPTNIVFYTLHEIGGKPFAVGAFLLPAILFLFQVRYVFKTIKREQRRRRKRKSREA